MKEQITTSQWQENVTGFARETRFAESQLALMLNLIGLVAIRRENLEWCSALWKIKRQKKKTLRLKAQNTCLVRKTNSTETIRSQLGTRLAKDGEDVKGLQITNSNEFSRNLSRSWNRNVTAQNHLKEFLSARVQCVLKSWKFLSLKSLWNERQHPLKSGCWLFPIL